MRPLRRGVLFDFDGTLIDTWRLYLESFRRSLEPHFKRLLTDFEILEYQPIAERRLLQEVVEQARFLDYFQSFLLHYRSLHETHCDGLYPGAIELLNGLKAEGYALGIVTGKSREAWAMTFGHSKLAPFDAVVTDNDVTHPKPHPEGLLAALQMMDVEPSHAIYIGDSVFDCQAAHAAKIRFGAALWSKSTDEGETFRKTIDMLGDAQYFSSPSSVLEGLKAWTDHD
ncbi:MAG TPA: HAD family hydrolase [Nitrospiraceae bacterium]|nr:HAD family hydrolase [Nitrospiraceae bacterium]